MRLLLALLLGSCGSHAIVIDPPNTVSICDRALVCGAILDGQHDACVACLEHVDKPKLTELRESYGDIPPLDSVSCETVVNVVQRYTNLSMCVVARWYGP